MNDFKLLIEETVLLNKQPAIIVCHSMGCLFSYTFLKQQDELWKTEYIRAYIVLAAPFGGNFKYMYSYIGDDDWPATMSKAIRIPERTFSSTAFLMPYTRAFENDALIRTPTRNYTVADYRDFFAAMDYPNAYEQRLDTENILEDELTSPGNFPVVCVGGVGVRSMESVTFSGELARGAQYTINYGDGDGILNTKGMKECLKFRQGASNFTYQGKLLRIKCILI